MNPLRIKLSDKVNSLRYIIKDSKLYQNLISQGIDQSKLDEYIDGKVLKKPQEINKNQVIEDMHLMFELGGSMSGSGAISKIFTKQKVKDFDFYFNDDTAFVKAYLATYHNQYIDVCYYFDNPYELHDIGMAMCCIWPDGTEDVSEECRNSIETKISNIFPGNVIWPERTAKRLLKYHDRYGLRYHAGQMAVFCTEYKIEEDMATKLFAICVS